jgi:hypothetical protein
MNTATETTQAASKRVFADVPPEWHLAFKTNATLQGKTMAELLIEVLEKQGLFVLPSNS